MNASTGFRVDLQREDTARPRAVGHIHLAIRAIVNGRVDGIRIHLIVEIVIAEPVVVVSDLALGDQLVDIGRRVLAVDVFGRTLDIAVIVKETGIDERIAECVRSLDIL